METARLSASEYFRKLSPLKAEMKSPVLKSLQIGSTDHHSRAGRCHCCPYGYHIDLDFVRYCQTIDKGSKNDTPTLTKLKKLKRERRRETKSMEMMLGLRDGEQGSSIKDRSPQRQPKQLYGSDVPLNAAGRKLTPGPGYVPAHRKPAPPSPPPRKESLRHPILLQSPPPPDLINSSTLVAYRRREEAADALKEAVQNFEETLENSRETKTFQRRLNHEPNFPGVDLLHHTPSSHLSNHYRRPAANVGRSNSLPRQFPNEPVYFRQGQGYNNWTNSQNYSPSYSYQTPSINDTMAAFNAARNYSYNQAQDIDTMSMTSGMSGVSTSTLQSIREQMATGLSRLKDLEAEVKKIPSLQLKNDVLREEKKLLYEQVKALKAGIEPPMMPPTIDLDSDVSEDELEGRLCSLKRRTHNAHVGRKRSPSPLRVNLEDFKSYRRARASSASEGSDNESVQSLKTRGRNENRLIINEGSDLEQRSGERRRKDATQMKKRFRDIGVGSRVVTRDVGVSYVAPRLRSIAVGTEQFDFWKDKEKKREITPKPCITCLRRNQREFETKAVGTEVEQRDSGRLSMSSISLDSFEPDEDEPLKSDDPKSSFLNKLGKKSPLISRLSEPQLQPPVLTFDNGTNTDPLRQSDKRTNTNVTMSDIFTRDDIRNARLEAKEQAEAYHKTARKSSAKDAAVQIDYPKPTVHSVGLTTKPQMRDVAVTAVKEAPKVRTIAVGECQIQEVKSRTRSIGVETDAVDDKKRTRNVQCGTGDDFRIVTRNVAVGEGKVVEKAPEKHTRNAYCQVLPHTRDASVEANISPKEDRAAPVAEPDRKSFGSAGVTVCDKCHDAITTVAKDIVGTSVPADLPPLPVQGSKIPRLFDTKEEKVEVQPYQAPVKPHRPAPETKPKLIPTMGVKPPFVINDRKTKIPEIKDDDDDSPYTSLPPSQQKSRIPFSRQDTYSKSGGLVNPAFEETISDEKSQSQRASTSPTRKSPSEAVTDAKRRSVSPPKKTSVDLSLLPESMSDPEAIIQGIEEEPTTTSVSSSSDEDSGGESLALSEVPSMLSTAQSTFSATTSLPPISISQQSSSSALADGKTRKKSVPTRELKAALKVLNDSIGKPARSGQQLTNAMNIIQRDWFKVSSHKDADPVAVEENMDSFEDYSRGLLQRVVNLADTNGNTAMHYAVSHGNFDVVSILLDSKVCNINQQNKAGYTASMLVALAQIRNDTHAGVVNRLFQLGDVNIKASQHGQTALMLAVSHGRLDMVRLLIAAGADGNIQDEDGSTALMCAAEHGHLAIVKFLLGQSDTDLYLMDNDGSTALTIAVEAGHKDVGVLLYKHMNLSRGSSPYASAKMKRSRTPTHLRPAGTPPPRSSAPPSPGRSRKSSGRSSPAPRQSSASLSNLLI